MIPLLIISIALDSLILILYGVEVVSYNNLGFNNHTRLFFEIVQIFKSFKLCYIIFTFVPLLNGVFIVG